ncbi:carboxylesterase 1C [Drosophila novamexicana]|uniref:carboxylesterase 1C n=1 Tax=Drosophila novamexicana TaxID=47314 RepID=UPI0011E5C46E|nr:carboxylesterase 1C [Drosophila novamexicana]XP_030557319.1 carboxylesterase 1C [Drosophila novamexicana]
MQMFRIFICLILNVWLSVHVCWAQQTHIKLEQGDLIGLKVFPDGARSAVYAFLGIPYAQPPLGSLRFAPAKPHNGWNRTLQATAMQPICPQLSNTIYDESADGSISRAAPNNEDCLYLNIWTPETGLRYGQLPMLVIISGEDFAYDWSRNRINGLDFAAAESVVVVSVQYRSNIYGWLGLGQDHRQLPGNYGLSDIQLALRWLQRYAQSFGGNPDQLTLLGHGSGAILALAAALQPSDGASLFKQLILMSPGPVLYALGAGHQQRIVATGRVLVHKLGCQFEEAQHRQLLSCLRRKSAEDLLRAYESVYNHGNASMQLGVQLSYPGDLEQHLANVSLPPLLLGIGSNEGAFMQDYWLDVARDGHPALHGYINSTLLPNVLRSMQLEASASEAQLAAIRWRYFNDEASASASQLLWGMQRLLSESLYETPFLRLLQLLNDSSSPSYAYVFDQSHAHAMDMRGRQNLFGGASHSADLPLLLGPSLFQQIARRRFSAEEEQLCRKLRGSFANFVKSGNPTPGRIYDAWQSYTPQRTFIYALGELSKSLELPAGVDEALIEQLLSGKQQTDIGSDRSLSRTNRHDNYRQGNSNSYVANNQLDSGYGNHLRRVYGFWQVLLPTAQDAELRDGRGGALRQRVRLLEANADAARYRQGFYAMLGLVCLLLACLGLCVYLLRRELPHSRRISSTEPSYGL